MKARSELDTPPREASPSFPPHAESALSAGGLPKSPEISKAATHEFASETKTLPNGAILTLRNWGPLVTKGAVDSGLVLVEAPGGGSLLFGRNVKATLSKTRTGIVRVEAEDGRGLIHEPLAPTYSLRLSEDKRLAIDVSGERSIVAEPGTELTLHLRSDGFAVSFVFGQTYYLKAGRPVAVDTGQGLKLGQALARKLQGSESR
jgi:hypothetical protein